MGFVRKLSVFKSINYLRAQLHFNDNYSVADAYRKSCWKVENTEGARSVHDMILCVKAACVHAMRRAKNTRDPNLVHGKSIISPARTFHVSSNVGWAAEKLLPFHYIFSKWVLCMSCAQLCLSLSL
jgi:hypothetical protein